jgi:hypothetical protein
VYVGEEIENLYSHKLNRLYGFDEIVNTEDDIVALVFGNGLHHGYEHTIKILEEK